MTTPKQRAAALRRHRADVIERVTRKQRDVPVTIYVTVWIPASQIAETLGGKNVAAAEAAEEVEAACRNQGIEVVAEPMEYER